MNTPWQQHRETLQRVVQMDTQTLEQHVIMGKIMSQKITDIVAPHGPLQISSSFCGFQKVKIKSQRQVAASWCCGESEQRQFECKQPQEKLDSIQMQLCLTHSHYTIAWKAQPPTHGPASQPWTTLCLPCITPDMTNSTKCHLCHTFLRSGNSGAEKCDRRKLSGCKRWKCE